MPSYVLQILSVVVTGFIVQTGAHLTAKGAVYDQTGASCIGQDMGLPYLCALSPRPGPEGSVWAGEAWSVLSMLHWGLSG